VDDEVAALEAERVDRLPGPARQPRPRVIEVLGAVGETEPGKVEGDGAKPLARERRHHLAVEERARRDAVEEDHGGARALLADEASRPAGVEAAPRGAVDIDRLACGRIHGAESSPITGGLGDP
jgi:hypothetical protein